MKYFFILQTIDKIIMIFLNLQIIDKNIMKAFFNNVDH
jgi:hypothetical protein